MVTSLPVVFTSSVGSIGVPDRRADRLTVPLLPGGSKPEREIIEELYMGAFGRAPTEKELSVASKAFAAEGATRKDTIEDLMWGLINSAEFVFNH